MPLAFREAVLRLVLPLPAENLGVSAFGLLCIGQNKPGSVTAPLKPKWFKNPLSGSAQRGVQETSAGLWQGKQRKCS